MLVLLLAMILGVEPAAQQPPPVERRASAATDGQLNLPVSLDHIKEALEQPPPAQPLRGLNEVAQFRVEITEKQKIRLEDLINSLDFKTGPVPPGGLYGYEQQRQVFPPVDNPLRQPYAAFNQPELVTVLVENLVGYYLAGKAGSAISSEERARAEAAARQEVVRAITEYCARQPNSGAGIAICANPSAVR
jgi:hypothetical protein